MAMLVYRSVVKIPHLWVASFTQWSNHTKTSVLPWNFLAFSPICRRDFHPGYLDSFDLPKRQPDGRWVFSLWPGIDEATKLLKEGLGNWPGFVEMNQNEKKWTWICPVIHFCFPRSSSLYVVTDKWLGMMFGGGLKFIDIFFFVDGVFFGDGKNHHSISIWRNLLFTCFRHRTYPPGN